ncbi:MAG: (d)CMP kinase [Pseudomonadota bacterium]
MQYTDNLNHEGSRDKGDWIKVAVDGQAASGKGTISRLIAERFDLRYLDTGKLYRALTYYMIKKGRKKLTIRDHDAFFRFLVEQRPSDADLQSDFISRHTPEYAREAWVRRLLLKYQKDFACEQVDGCLGALLDGRDIGTVVLPDATVKVFVTAELEVRAQRRTEQLTALGETASYERVYEDLKLRDDRDSQRSNAPLLASADAILLDTTRLSIAAATEKVAAAIEAAQNGGA